MYRAEGTIHSLARCDERASHANVERRITVKTFHSRYPIHAVLPMPCLRQSRHTVDAALACRPVEKCRNGPYSLLIGRVSDTRMKKPTNWLFSFISKLFHTHTDIFSPCKMAETTGVQTKFSVIYPPIHLFQYGKIQFR